MIFIYQLRTLTHTTLDCPDITCPLCKHTGLVRLSIQQRYVWFIGPIVPSRKFGIAYCGSCGNQIPAIKWTNELVHKYNTAKAAVKTPLRLWRGMVVLPLICALVVIAGSFLLSLKSNDQQKRAATVQEYTLHPAAGDLYQIIVPGKDGTSFCSYARYQRTSGDTLFVVLNRKLVPYNQNWEGLDTESADAFDVHEVPVSRALMEQNAILSVVGHPGMAMTVWAIKRDGHLVKKY